MTKTASIVILSIICVIALFFGVCSCLPGGLEYGEYNIYNSAINLFQGSSLFSDSVVASYTVKCDEGTTEQQVASAVRSRLGSMYGRWFADVSVNANKEVVVKVPVTANSTKVNERSILSDVTSIGKVEILTQSTYGEEYVILTSEHVAGMNIKHYSYGSNAYYILNLRLNKAGKEIASEYLKASSSSWSAYLAIDGTVSYGVAYDTKGNLQVYTGGDADCQRVRGFIKSGALAGTLTALDNESATENKTLASVGGLIFGIVCAAIVLGSWIFYAVRYKLLAIPAALSQLIAIVTFIMFGGMVYFAYLNIASAIAIILGYGLMSCFTCLTMGKIRSSISDKTFASARYRAFSETNKWNVIVHAIVLVAGIILWLIPTGITLPIGNTLVYWAVLSFIATMGLNRLFTGMIAPLGGDEPKNYGVAA